MATHHEVHPVIQDRQSAPGEWMWVTFMGGTLDGKDRLVQSPLVYGDDYVLRLTDERWVWVGSMFMTSN